MKKNYLSFITVICAIAVLTLHTNGVFWEFSATGRYWITANIIESVFYFGVPLFFMMSGITLMDFLDNYSIKEFFIRRMHKTFIPFVAWSMISLIFLDIIGEVDLMRMGIFGVLRNIFHNESIGIFWFFRSLFILYLCMPLFSAVNKEYRKTIFTYLVVVGLILNSLIPFIQSIFSFDWLPSYNVPVVLEALIWVPLGWLLDQIQWSPKQRMGIYLLAIIGLLMHIVGTYFLSVEAGEIVKVYKGYGNIPSILYACGMFVFLKQVGQSFMDKKMGEGIQWLSQYSFPIYLMQFILLRTVRLTSFINRFSIGYRLLAPYVMIAVIICATYCLRKIPILEKIVPK